METIMQSKKNRTAFISILSAIILCICSLWGWYIYNNHKTLAALDKTNTDLTEAFHELENKNSELTIEKEKLVSLNDEITQKNEYLVSKLEKLQIEIKTIKEESQFIREELNKKLTVEEKNQNTKKLPSKKTIYLTFDDGPSHNTERILDILKEENIKATFFVNGNDSDYAKKMYKRIVDEGHAIGNHTYSHDYGLVYSSFEDYWEDTMKLDDLIYNTTGIRSKLIRFPGGSNNEKHYLYNDESNFMNKLKEKMLGEGYQYFDWNISSLDASPTGIDKMTMINAVLTKSKYKYAGVILFHDSSAKKVTAEAIPEIIKGLRAQGFSFDKLSVDGYTVHFK